MTANVMLERDGNTVRVHYEPRMLAWCTLVAAVVLFAGEPDLFDRLMAMAFQ